VRNRFLTFGIFSFICALALSLTNCGGGGSSPAPPPANNPVPNLTSISPTSATAGGTAFTLTVNGSNFISGSTVRWGGANRTTTFMSSTQLTAAITAGDIASAATVAVTVSNPTPGGGTSNGVNFSVNPPDNPAPALTSLRPSSARAGGAAFTLNVNGTNFISGSSVRWGSSNRSTTYLSSTQLTAVLSADDISSAGTVAVTVFNPSPGGGTSSALSFNVHTGTLGRNDSCPTGATAILNGVTRASISPYGDVDVYSFQGTAGQKVTIEIYAQRLVLYGDPSSRDVFLDSFLELLNSSCAQLTYNDDIDLGVIQDSLIQNFTLPGTGTNTYYIRVSDLRGDGRPDFIYELHLSGAN